MAITKIIKIKGSVNGCVDYITNAKKTDEYKYVTCDGCTEQTASYIFKMANMKNERYKDDGSSIKAYHIIQSFSKDDDISPEKANQIGMELMKRLFDNKYSFICATHIDHDHIHNHILVCAAEKTMNGKKINDNLSLLHKLQNTSDELCAENGLNVIHKKNNMGKNYREWYEDLNNPNGSKKSQLRNLIDTTIKTSTNFNDFIEQMKAAGASVEYINSKNYGRVAKYKLPNASETDRWNRGYNLGAAYSDSVIEKRIRRRLEFIEARERRRTEREANKAAMTKAEKIIDRGAIKIGSMIDTSENIVTSVNYGLTKWKNKQNAMRMNLIQKELHDKYGIEYTSVKAKINSLVAENNRLRSDIESKDISKLREIIEYCQIFCDTHSIYEEYRNCTNKESFYERHDKELNAFYEASARIDLTLINRDKLLTNPDGFINSLKNSLSKFEEQNEAVKEQIRQNETDIAELKNYQKEIDIYLGRRKARDINSL